MSKLGQYMKSAAAATVGLSLLGVVPIVALAAEGPQEQAKSSEQSKIELGKEAKTAMEVYVTASDALASDDLAKAKAAAKKAEKLFAQAAASASKAHKDAFTEAASGAKALAQATDLDAARKKFSDLSESVVKIVSQDPELREQYNVFYCPMVKGFNKWVQTSEKIHNPYMGKRMQSCGAKA